MSPTQQIRIVFIGRIVAVVLIAVLALRIAWMSDDALITLRTVLNITHEWGPGYNATERVMAFTHPLWFLLWVTLGTLTNQWVVGLLIVSVVLTAAAAALVVWRTDSLTRLIVATGLLLFSNAFMDYATSGLENALVYLLVGVLIALTLRGRYTVVTAALVGLTASAIFLTRFDLALLVAPAGLLLAWRWRTAPRLLAAASLTALAPLVVWFTWAKLTYDAWLPNTFEAKRNVNIPATELVVQGIRYLWVTFEHDPVSFIGLVVGVLAAATLGRVIHRAWAVGIVLYLGYVVWIGGDFMAGRFVAVPVYASVFLFAAVPWVPKSQSSNAAPEDASRTAAQFVTGAVAIAALLGISTLAGSVPVSLSATEQQRWEIDQNLNAFVIDARGASTSYGMNLRSYMNRLSLAYVNPDIAPLGDSTGLSRELREVDKAARNWPTGDGNFTLPSEVGVFCGFLGNLGIATGPAVHLIDNCALTDRYLASKPYTPSEPFAWNPGHFHREIPEGYVDAVKSDDPSRMADTAEQFRLRQLWSRIRG